jgi:hypothetical protein
MAQNTATHELPTSEWEHSHAVEEGDVLVLDRHDRAEMKWRVTTVEDNGNVRLRRIDDGRRDADERDTWDESSLANSLAFGDIKRERDGLSHELATF